MKNALSDEYGKRFQLTDSLLKRLLSREDYDRIKTVEPVFVFTNETICKQLKNPGYKHAAISSNFLYIVNTPAKHDSDLVFAVPLAEVEDVKVIYDTADFLQGDLRESSQHIHLSCKQHFGATENLLFHAASLALLSSTDVKDLKNGGKVVTRPRLRSASDLSPENSNETILRQCKSLSTSPSSSLSQAELEKFKIKSGENERDSTKELSRRPLPKPLDGTELLNASYTSSALMSSLQTKKNQKVSGMNASKNMGKLPLVTDQVPRLPLTKTQKKYLLSSSLNQSWNDIIRAEQSTSLQGKQSLKPSNDDITSEVSSSATLDETLSSKVFKLVKGSKDSVAQNESSTNQSTEELNRNPRRVSNGETVNRKSRKVSSSSDSESSKTLLEEYQVEIFTIAQGSNFFNIIEQSWIYSLIAKTSDMKTSYSSSSVHSLSSQKKVERDEAIQKFTQLKNEILTCDHDDELFLLTKELKYASDHYLFIRKAVWKSSTLLRFYLDKLKALISSRSTRSTERMDELDVAILIGDFLVSIFQDSEMFSGRNMVLNENSGKFVKDLIDTILMSPRMKCLSTTSKKKKQTDDDSQNDELYDLISSWLDASVSILFEVINAAKQSIWCCNLEIKHLDIIMLSQHLQTEERGLKNLIDHLVLKLTSQLTTEWESPPSPSSVVLLYKCLVVLHFVCTRCPTILDYVKTYYHEEFKYYISKKDNIDKIPPNYPITCLIASFLPTAISTIT